MKKTVLYSTVLANALGGLKASEPAILVIRRVRNALTMGCATVLLTGCAVYLHDDRLQKQTTAALEAYKAAKVPDSIKAVIAAQGAFDQRMLDSVIAEDAALRDQDVAQLLANGNAKALQDQITDRLTELGGPGFNFVPNDWRGGLAARDLSRVSVEGQTRVVGVLARRYKEAGGTNYESCDEPFGLPAGASPALTAAHTRLALACSIGATFAKTARERADKVKSRVCSARDGSLLNVSCTELELADTAIAADEAAAKSVTEAMKAARRKVDEATRNLPVDERVTQALTDFNDDLAKADRIAGALGSDQFKPGAALAAIEFRKTNLCDVLAASANASCDKETDPSQAAKDINKAIVGVIAGFAKITGYASVPDTDALSIALAYQTGRQKAVQASLSGLKSRRALLEGVQNAAIREVEYLLQAQVALDGAKTDLAGKACAVTGFAALMKNKDCKAGNAVAQALTAYGLSWAEGRTASRVAQTRITELITMTNLRVAQANAEARDAVLTTALAELDAFGQGGVSPQTIAEFLQAIGIAAIAKGVN
jgi:hypothetical protein